MKAYFVIINPAAGGGNCGKQASQTLTQLVNRGLKIESVQTQRPGQASQLCQEAYQAGFRRFLAVGGDGTSFEIVNGLFPRQGELEPIYLVFLPLGTGNSFLRDFSQEGLHYAVEAIHADRSRPCDVMRLTHQKGVCHYINLLSLGFTAEAGSLTNRRFKNWGEPGYLMAILCSWLRLRYPTFHFRWDGQNEDQPCTYLTFSNSRFTGGKLMIAPQANMADGLIEITRVGPISRWDFLKTFPKIFSGNHMKHPLIWRTSARRVEFEVSGTTAIMIDGEILLCKPMTIDVLPGALQVMV